MVCVALPLCAIGSVHPASALVFLSEFPSRRWSADQGWRASSALVFISQGFPSLRLEAITRLLTAWWSRRRTPRGFPLGMTVPPANPPRPGGIIASWSGTAYSTRQVWLISQLTSISEGLSPIRHPGTRLVGDGRPTTELEVAYSRVPGSVPYVHSQWTVQCYLINNWASFSRRAVQHLTFTIYRLWCYPHQKFRRGESV